jgi:hypothetical protein
MRVAPFALLTGLLPLLCIHLTYLLAASQGHVDWCVPYWDSCTSISATGREMPEKLVFKLLMMPAGLCATGFWWLVRQWLLTVHGVRSRAVFVLGTWAALFMLLYVAALGESDEYRWARQTGIILFFSLSYVAQLCFLFHLLPRIHSSHALQWRVCLWQLYGAITLLAIGIFSIILDFIYPRYDDIEDAFEWVMMLFIVLQFCSHYFLWKDTDLRLEVSGKRQ